MTILGDRLVKARGAMQQKELERLSGVSQSMISQIEKGRRVHPSAFVLERIESALGLPRGFLTAPEPDTESLKAYENSDFGKEDRPTADELMRLSRFSWEPVETPTPAAWSALLHAIRKGRGA